MKNGILFAAWLLLLISCSKDEADDSQMNLKEKFHGKYELISSKSEEAVDINMDGVSSNNLLVENPEISGSKLELRILNSSEHLFTEGWPVETIIVPRGETLDSTRYHPTYRIYYALHGYGRMCRFSKDFMSIQLIESTIQDTTNTLIQIESITTEEKEMIKVLVIRKLYTMKGWIKARIESKYRRYTTIT